jgi:hypothetical protein
MNIPIIDAPQILISKLQKCVAMKVREAKMKHVKYVPLFNAFPGELSLPIRVSKIPIIDAKSPIAQKQKSI